MEISTAQLALMLATIALVLASGLYAARSIRSAEGFSLNGRSAGAPLVAGTIAGTCVGGGATVGTAQLAYSLGLSAWWFTLGTGIALVVMGLFYARPLRRTSLETIPEFLGIRYGKSASVFSSLVSSVGIFFSAVASMLPGLHLISTLFGVGYGTAAFALIALVACYVFFGGMKSAGVGGILKMIVLWLSLCLAGVTAWRGLPALTAATPLASGTWSLGHAGAQSIAAGLLSLIVGIISTQSYIQAIFSAANPRTATVGAFTAALIVIPVGLPSSIIGIYMHAAAPDIAPILALPTYLFTHAGTLIGSIAMGGIVLSLVGSIGGLSLGIGTMLSHDVFAPLLAVKSEGRLLLLNRLMVLLVMALAALFAICFIDSEVLVWNYLSMALRGGGIFLPLTLAIFFPERLSPRWAIASMLLSTAAAVAAAAFESAIHPLFIGLIVSAALILPGICKEHTWRNLS